MRARSNKLSLMLGMAMLNDNAIKYELEDFSQALTPSIDRTKLDLKQEDLRTKRIQTKMAKAETKRNRKQAIRLRLNQQRGRR